MSPLDWVLLAVLLISTVQGLRRGLLLTLTAIAGLVLGTLAASWYSPRLALWLQPRMHNWIPSFAAAEIFSFLAIAFAVMLIAHIFGRALRGGVRTIGLGWADRILGGMFGFARGVVFLGIVFTVLSLFFPGSSWIQTSRLAPYGLYAARTMSAAMPPDAAQRTINGARRLGSQARQ